MCVCVCVCVYSKYVYKHYVAMVLAGEAVCRTHGHEEDELFMSIYIDIYYTYYTYVYMYACIYICPYVYTCI